MQFRIHRKYLIAFVLAAGFLIPQYSFAADWPGWLGPQRNGVSTETVSPWKESPQVVWRIKAGEGHSSPVIAMGKAYIFSKVHGEEAEELTCLDSVTGKKYWSSPDIRPAFANQFGNGPRATPQVGNGKVFTHGASGMLVARDAQSGKILWRLDTLKEFQGKNLFFGASSSPLLFGDTIVVMVGGKNAGVVALETDTGKILWKSTDDRASYSSPIINPTITNGVQVLALTQRGLVCLNATNGQKIWQFGLVDKLNESSTTPVVQDGKVVISSVTVGAAQLDLGQDGKQLWKSTMLNCYFSTPCHSSDGSLLMMVTGRILPPVASILRCVDPANGKILWSRPNTGKYHAAILRLADGKMLLHDDFGELALFEPDAKEYRELCRSKVGGPSWSHPALADGLLYLRDEKELTCLKLP